MNLKVRSIKPTKVIKVIRSTRSTRSTKINILNQHLSARIPSAKLKKILRRTSRALGLTDTEINFLFVSDRVIRKYNQRYLKHDRPTDVIAFPYDPGPLLADIVVSIDTAKWQARDEGHSLLTELSILCVHGLLHILGYRDKTKKDRNVMWKKTYELLGK